MSLREKISGKPIVGISVTALFILTAAAILASTYWPEKQADLSKAFYSDDDGQTWFVDSATKVAPFDHNGKQAVVAHVYTYDNGGKSFCAYLAKFTPAAKAKLEAAIAEAAKKQLPPESVGLFHDPGFSKQGVLVKPAGGGTWISYGDPKANAVFTIHAPDGSAVDERFPG